MRRIILQTTAMVLLAPMLVSGFAQQKRRPKPSPKELYGQPLDLQIAKILADPAVSRAHWGIAVTTLDGAPVYSLNEGQYFVPASNNKLFTTATALALLGPDRTFSTRVVTSGSIVQNALQGDLVLVGGGEANLSGRTLPYLPPSLQPHPAPPPPDPLRYLAQMADQVAATGLRAVSGNIVGDDALFPWEPYPEDWSIQDTVGDDGAPVSALTVNDNRIDLVIAAGIHPGDPATFAFQPDVPYYDVEMHVTTGPAKSENSVHVDRDLGSRTVRVWGSIPVDAHPRAESLAVHDPAEFAAIAFKQLLEQRGIIVTGKAKTWHNVPQPTRSFLSIAHEPLRFGPVAQPQPARTVLASHTSEPLAEDLVVTNKVSQNLHAEIFLHQLAVNYTGEGSTAQGARVVRTFLMQRVGVDPDDYVAFDGSGLSGHDLVTPRATVKLLQYAARQPWFALWKQSLPIGGEDGTLSSRFPAAPMKDHLYAKTGTLSEARALSGYLDAASGRALIFSVFVSTHYPRTNADRDAMDKIVTAIAAAN